MQASLGRLSADIAAVDQMPDPEPIDGGQGTDTIRAVMHAKGVAF